MAPPPPPRGRGGGDMMMSSQTISLHFHTLFIVIKNIFDIDFSQNAARNIALRPTPVSPLRDMTSYYKDYSLFKIS